MTEQKAFLIRFTPCIKCVLVLVVLVSVCLLVFAYLFGRQDGIQADQAYQQRIERLEIQNNALDIAVNNQRRRAVRAETTANIDRLAAEDVRKSLLTYRREVADLQADVEFYRRLMAPEELDKGLGIYSFTLVFDTVLQQYRYSALVTNSANQNPVVKGQLGLQLRGTLLGSQTEGEPVPQIKLVDIENSPDFDSGLPATLRFRFFQKVEGSFKLPEDFQPDSILLTIVSEGKHAQQLKRQFQWAVLLGQATRSTPQGEPG